MMQQTGMGRLLVLGWLVVTSAGWAETHSEIQTVDASGNATHPKILGPGVPAIPVNRVTLEGIVLNGSPELGSPATTLLIAFQGEGNDHAGTQIWSGVFFHDPASWHADYDDYIFGIRPGDRIRANGFCAPFVGKTNVNEQHSDDPARNFTIEVIGHPGMPVPETVPDVVTAISFDASRQSGGEYYQSRWVRLNGLSITTETIGFWGVGGQVTVTDGTGQMGMMLSETGDFNDVPAPTGSFDVVALFDQEPNPLDFNAPRTAHYRLWVKRNEHVLSSGAPFLVTAWSRRAHGEAGDFDVDVSIPGAIEVRQGGPSKLVVVFDRDVAGAGGLDVSDVVVSSGQVTAISVTGGELIADLVGVTDAASLMVTFPGIESAAGGVAVEQSLCFAVLGGDVNADRAVNIFDLIATRNQLNQPVSAANFLHDVQADGNINIFDLISIRNHLNHALAVACP